MNSQARISESCRCLLFVVYISLLVFSFFTNPFLKPPSLHLISPQPLSPFHLSLSELTLQYFLSLVSPCTKNKALAEMDSVSNARRPCFIEEDDGLASLADMEAGFSGIQHPFFSRPMCYSKKGSFGSNSSLSPRSGRFWDARFEEHQPHFLEACFLCKKPLGDNRDIFMYRGDTPFCSEECRAEQIETDEAKEKNWNLSSSMKALRKREQRKSSSSNTSKDYSFRPGTVAAA